MGSDILDETKALRMTAAKLWQVSENSTLFWLVVSTEPDWFHKFLDNC